MPSRLLDAFAPRRAPVNRADEPLLAFEQLPQSPASLTAIQPPARRAIELALEEGSRRLYLPMREAQVLERSRRR